MKKSVTAMVNEALALITTHSVETARALHGQPGVQFIDLRDPRELEREGTMPGAFHAPRGMLEFWVDTESPYHKPVFNQPGTQYVLFCAGGWRSALAARTMLEMGIENVAHIHGGFGAWKASGAPVAPKAERPAKPAPGPAAA
jgi:rhodanese-related sulfurtransferase